MQIWLKVNGSLARHDAKLLVSPFISYRTEDFPFVINGKFGFFYVQYWSRGCIWEPEACWDRVLHLCCPFALPLNPFHFSHEQTVSAWTNNPAILQSTPRLQYQTKGGPRGPAQAKECSFGVLLHKFNQHDKKEIIWAFVMIWKGEVCVPLIAVWPIARPRAWPTVEPYR